MRKEIFNVSVPLSGLASVNTYPQGIGWLPYPSVSVPLSGLASVNASVGTTVMGAVKVSVPLSGLASVNVDS